MAKAKSGGGGSAPASSNKGEGAQAAISNAKAIAKAATPNARESRVEDSKKQQAAKPFKNSLPSLTSNFKGVGVAPYLDKDGKVKNLDNTTKIDKSGGPSGDGTIVSDDFDNSKLGMDPIPEATNNTTPVVVKTPTRNVTNISDLVPQYDAEYISQILFENLSAVELSRVERHDTIEGINQRYSIVSNLSEIRKRYEITKQLTVMDKFRPLTKIFTIDIESKIPQEDYIELEGLDSTYKYINENNIIIEREKGYYYIDTNGDLVIELVNLERSQEVEIQIATSGTIYKIEKVESWLQQMVKIL